MDISIILPAYNEEKNIAEAIRLFAEELQLYSYEIIVVDDGSEDSTAEIVMGLQQGRSDLRLIQHSNNRGYGAALRSGFSNSISKWCFFTDSDLQFHPRDFHRLWNSKEQYEVILGYRHPRKDPWIRRLNAKMWGVYVRYLLGVNVRDINCAFKLFKRDILEDIHLESEGALINAEFLAQICQREIQFCEIPVEHFARKAGNQTGAKISVIISAFQESFSLRQRLR